MVGWGGGMERNCSSAHSNPGFLVVVVVVVVVLVKWLCFAGPVAYFEDEK